MKKSILLFLIFIIHFHLDGQVDSLFNVYKNEKEDLKARGLMMKIQSLCKKNFQCYAPIITHLQNNSMDDQNARMASHLISAMTSSFLYNEITDYGSSYARRIVQFNPQSKWLAQLYSNIATAYVHLTKIDSALYYAEKSEKLLHSLDDQSNFWKPDYVRYTAYNAINNSKLSFDYLKKSYSYLINGSDRMNKGFILIELLGFTKNNKMDNEFDLYLKEYVLFNKEGNKTKDAIHSNLSALFKGDKEGIAALEKKLNALEMEESKATVQPTVVVNHLSEKMKLVDLYAKNGESNKAILQLKKILRDTTISDMAIKTALTKLTNNYKDLGQLDSALHYNQLLNDQLSKTFEQNFSQKIAEYEVKYQSTLKENELNKNKALLAENKLQLRSLYGIVIGLLLISLISYLFYRHRIKMQDHMNKQEQEIQSQKIHQLEQENKMLALNSMIEGQEAERLRIAHDLHDGLGGLLTTVKAHFNAIEREINAVKNLNVYDQTNALIDKACIEVRRIAHNMVPHSIHISGLVGAMEDLKQSIESRGITCELDLHGIEELSIDQQKASMIYRIIQEVTNNSVKHSKADHILIQLMKNESALHIMIEDNGQGFDINQVLNNKGMGLRSIDSRIKYLNGHIHYDSSPNHGTTVNIEVGV